MSESNPAMSESPENASRTADILVIGAGPAGLAAATAAAGQGRRVLVLDDSPAAGGQIWRTGVEAPNGKHDIARTRAIEAFRRSGAELLPSRRIFDASPNGTVRALFETAAAPAAETYTAPQLILATGARERFLPFPGWTIPGVFGAGGLQALVKGGYNVAGKRVVLAGTGPLLLAVAEHLQQYGATVVSINEQTPFARLLPLSASLWRHPAKAVQGVRLRAALRGVPYRTGTWPTEAVGSSQLRSVTLTNGRRTWHEHADLLACGFHLVPNTELPALLGCRLQGGLVAVDAQQRTSHPNIFCVGEPTGIAGIDAAMLSGTVAGLHAAGKPQRAARLTGRRDRERRFGQRLDRAFQLRPELSQLAQPDTVVCRCEDVRYADLEPHPTWTEAKLQTRCGMGACQGRICGPAVQTLFGWRATSVRPPIFPVPLSVLTTELAPTPAAPQETQS